MHFEGHLPRLVELAIDGKIEQALALGSDAVERIDLDVNRAEYAQTRQSSLGAVDAVDTEKPSLAGTNARGDDMILDIDRFIADERAIPCLDRIGLAHGIVVDDRSRDIMNEITYLGVIGNVARRNHAHVNHALVLHTVSKVLQILRPEEIIAAVAHMVGDIDAYGAQRVQAIAAPRLEITVYSCQRVHQLHQRLLTSRVFHVTNCIRWIDVDIVGDFGLLGVTGRM